MVLMGDHNVDMTAGVEQCLEQPGRNSPSSAVCYMNIGEVQEPAGQNSDRPNTMESEPGHNEEESAEGPRSSAARADSESDSTPRSEVPSVLDASTLDPHQSLNTEPGYFSPQPLRLYSTKLSASATNSANPSPTTSLNASTTSVHDPHPPISGHTEQPSTPTEHQDRPSVQRDLESTSTTSASTVRALSTDPIQQFTLPSQRQRDGPHYPNQSYAALHSQHYPTSYTPHLIRARSSHPAHYSSHSAAHISTFGLSHEHQHNIMDSGSRTVGNSPASSPGLFSPTTPPLRHTQQTPDDQGFYPSPYLHHTQRQVPKETHIADVDVDPVSGRKIINQYEVIDELGRGVHGKVKLGRNLETGVFVAIKIVDRYSKRRRLGKNTSHEDKIKREIAILKKARHPNIVSLLEVIDDPSRKKVYIVLEHVELGEVKWRTEGAKEVALVEWRRYQRESEGVFDNDNAAMEDERIIALAHQKLERQQRRRMKELHNRRLNETGIEPWSFEHGGDSDGEISENGRSSRASMACSDGRPPSRHQFADRHEDHSPQESNMETAYRSSTPTAPTRHEEQNIMSTGLEGTMYGPYDTELIRGRTPSLTGSNSSRFTDGDDEIPEHFRYVPLMTIQAARETFRDTVLGLEYLHYQGVIHRDIKPANLLQTKEHRIKISDFGVSYLGRQTSEDSTGDQSESDVQDADEAVELAKTVGTPAFYAPELCRTDLEADTPPVTGKIDVWALGVTLYCLIFGRVPFHDNNTFVLMRLISDTDVYIPRYRLKAVSEKPSSRPNSHGRMYHSMTTSRRAPHDLEYEEVDDLLHDLLKKLLIKDSRKRISIKEIKHHPWLLQGIDNFSAWVEDTDPGKSFQGRKIEISKDDVEKAVVPITLIDRVRSGVRKTLDTVLRMGQRGGSRRRAQSSATNLDQPISATSSSSTISQESRRPSLAVNQSIFEALKLSREPEHPLSQSVTASPGAKERAKFLDGSNSRTASPAHSVEGNERPAPLTGSSRPHPPERAYSTMSSATSIRTIRQSDLPRCDRATSPSIPPALPGTPTALDTPGGSNLGGIFGGVPRRLVNSVRSRERMLKPPGEHMRAKSIDRLVGTDDDPHSGPSIALSNTFAAGHVDPPAVLKDLSPTVGPFTFPDPHERASSRQSSVSSISSRHNRTYPRYDEPTTAPTQGSNAYPFPSLHRGSSDDRFSRAKEEFVRQRVREETQGRERPHSMNFPRPTSAFSQTACPPSPDDEVFFHSQRFDDLFNRKQQSQCSSIDTSPVSYPVSVNSAQSRALTSSSSEDHFTSMSQSTSNPSIPSVVSANSSIAPDDCFQVNRLQQAAHDCSEDTVNYFAAPMDDSAGYDGDHALESEDEDDDSDEEDFIVMTKKRSNKQGLMRSGSVSNAELARHNVRRELGSSRRRSARSGSNGTVKKIRPPGDSDNEEHNERASEAI
ncbi:kinase-like protein [Zopfia rhizophila CBS 207.26]|uniref:non-specific serine/threonine protein kinase n=1 Tax=Zopfia rhizophila CBS 207.26 TaxID=1314779 RepID=A0A6A6DGS8_9PEZI|nr:kinase-like protein [Zopfia rhizophila CBS 207.26]